MPTMQLFRLAGLCLVYKIKEILSNNDFSYTVEPGYPPDSEMKTQQTWPLITVQTDNLFGRDIELGSNQWPACQVFIDIFANTDGQREDIAYTLWNSLNENNYTLYNFNSGFPSAVGDYSGISTLGEYATGTFTFYNIAPPEETNIVGLKHHGVLSGVLYLPNLT